MPKIALIKFHESYSFDDYERIIDGITEWEEVTAEELKLLKDYHRNYNVDWTIIEFVERQKETIEFAVSAQIKHAKAFQEKQKKEQEERERKSLERRLKKEKKTIENKRKLLEELKAELGEE